MKLVKLLFTIALLCIPFTVYAQPQPGSDLPNSSITDLGDVSGVTGPSTVMATASAPHTAAQCLEFSGSGDIVPSGVACGGGGGATTEAALEAQLTDVTDVYTNNDGALVGVITDLSDVTSKSGNTTVVATTSGALTSGDCLAFDASGNIVAVGAACASGGATTEAGLESDLTDVSNVVTNNDASSFFTPSANLVTFGPDTVLSSHDACMLIASGNTGTAAGAFLQVCGTDHGTPALDNLALLTGFQISLDSASTEFSFGAVDHVLNGSSLLLDDIDFTIRQTGNDNWISLYPGTGNTGFQTAGTTWYGNSDAAEPGSIISWIGSNAGAEWKLQNHLLVDQWIFEHDFDLVPGADNAYDIGAVGTEIANVFVEPDVYAVGWDGSSAVPTKDAVYDKMEAVSAAAGVAFVTGSEVATADTFDTKIVYAKTINLGAMPNNTTTTDAHGVTGGIEFLLPHSTITAIRSTDNNTYVYNVGGTGFQDFFQIDLDNGGDISITSDSDRSLYTGTAILYYTKP